MFWIQIKSPLWYKNASFLNKSFIVKHLQEHLFKNWSWIKELWEQINIYNYHVVWNSTEIQLKFNWSAFRNWNNNNKNCRECRDSSCSAEGYERSHREISVSYVQKQTKINLMLFGLMIKLCFLFFKHTSIFEHI